MFCKLLSKQCFMPKRHWLQLCSWISNQLSLGLIFSSIWSNELFIQVFSRMWQQDSWFSLSMLILYVDKKEIKKRNMMNNSVFKCVITALSIRHGYRSKKFPAATYVRDCFINITKETKKLKKCVIFCNRNWLEVQYYELPYDQGQ